MNKMKEKMRTIKEKIRTKMPGRQEVGGLFILGNWTGEAWGRAKRREKNVKCDRGSRQVTPALAVHPSLVPRHRAGHGLHAYITKNVMLAATCEGATEEKVAKKERASVDIWIQSDSVELCVT